MPNLNVQFGGQTLIVPGAYYTDDVSAVLTTNPSLVPPLVWVAFSYGGQKNVPVTFQTAQDVTNFLRNAPCSDMVQWIFTPSSELNGASLVTVIPCGTNTASVFNFQDNFASSAIETYSANQGLPSNLLQASVVPGSIAGVEVTLFDGYANTSIYADNLGVPLQIAYAGQATGTFISFAVTQVADQATNLSTTGAPPGENLNITLGTGGYSTITEVAEYINGTGFWLANVTSAGPNYSHGNTPSQLLDACTEVALAQPASGVPQFVDVTANLTDVKYWLDTACTAFVTDTTLLTTSGTNVYLAPAPLTHFTGGTNVPPVLNDYAAALNVALTIPAWVVIADQNITGLPALLAQHATTASSITQRKFRRAVSGSNIADSVQAAINMAISLNCKEMTYCYPGMYRNQPTTGVSTLYGGYYVAAAVAGIMAGNPVMTPLTNKTLTGNGVEVQLSVSPQIDSLQQAGVLPIWVPDVNGVPTIISDFTTWQNDANPENVFNQQVAGRQYLAYVMYNAMQPYTGTIESNYSIVNQKKAAAAALTGQLITPTGSAGVLNSWVNSSLQLVYNGAQQLTAVTFQCTFVGQNRFTTIEAFVQPLNLTA